MLSIQESSKSNANANANANAKPTPSSAIHILPCRIQHTGPTKVSKRYWSPITESDGSSKTAYFRGRKLKGRLLDLPETYTGVLAKSTARELPKKFHQPVEADDRDVEEEQQQQEVEDDEEPVKILEHVADFKGITVWRHDHQPPLDDPFVRGLDDWIPFAHSIHTAGGTTGK